jgi:hypothetical protein
MMASLGKGAKHYLSDGTTKVNNLLEQSYVKRILITETTIIRRIFIMVTQMTMYLIRTYEYVCM